METFLYQTDRKQREDGVEIILYFINEKRESTAKLEKIDYIILAEKEKSLAFLPKSPFITISERKFKDREEKEVSEIHVKNKEMFDYINTVFREQGVQSYERDLAEDIRYLIDKKVKVLKGKNFPNLTTASLDIETQGTGTDTQILSAALSSPEKKELNKAFLNCSELDEKTRKELRKQTKEEFEIIELETEKELLETLFHFLRESKIQLILGWNVIDFDFTILKQRAEAHNVPFCLSPHTEEVCTIRKSTSFFRSSTMLCLGVLVFDAIDLIKGNFIEFEDYKLETVAQEVLGEGKIDVFEGQESEDKLAAISELYRKNPAKLLKYNFRDCQLTDRISSKLRLLSLMMQRSALSNTPLMKIRSPIATLDIMYLKKLHERGYVAPSIFHSSVGATPIEGAFVIEPEKGFYEDVFVFDFTSLYPSIIMTLNIDPFTYSKGGSIEAPNGARFLREKGILPELIEELFALRTQAKKEGDEVKSHALKITMNSFYGSVASPKCRFYNKEVGEAITAFGRKIIQETKSFLESNSHSVVYGDTDSVFVMSKEKKKTLEEKKAFAKALERQINEFFRKWCENKFGVESKLNIKFEKLFEHFFIASKKRYVGYDALSKKTSFTGMEAVRGDWTDLAKSFQVNLVNLIFSAAKKREIEEAILQTVKDLREGKLDETLVYKKKITKNLSEYTKTTPPHVKAARELTDFKGRLVEYVMTKKGPKHISLLTKDDEIDYEHYVEKQLKGVSDDILGAYGLDFDAVVKKNKQGSLTQFFS